MLGISTFEIVSVEIYEEYLGGELDIHSAIIHRPELFERAIITILGESGQSMLAYIWRARCCRQLDLSFAPAYEKSGDLVKCIAAVRARDGEGHRESSSANSFATDTP